jgi:hypothetical protein
MPTIIALSLAIIFFLLPSPARSQTYTGTASALNFGYYNGANYLLAESEWFWNSNAGSWFFSGVSFDVTDVVYYDYNGYLAGNVVSTNTTNYACFASEWSYGAYAQGVGRTYGGRLITLSQGYFHRVTVVPKTAGSLYVYPAGNSFFGWTGETKSMNIDLVHP